MRKLLVTALAVLASSGCTMSVAQSSDEADPPSSRRLPSPPQGSAEATREAVGTAAADSLWWPPPPPLPPGPFDADAAPAGDEDTGTADSCWRFWPPLTPPHIPRSAADRVLAPGGGAQGTTR